MNYNLNDNELIYMIREDDEEALFLLMKKYEPLIKNIAFSYYKMHDNMNVDFEDLVQELNYTLVKCVKGYKETLDVKFFSYLLGCLRRGSFNYFQRSSYYSNKIYETLDEDISKYEDITVLKDNVYDSYNDYEFDNKIISFKHSLNFFDSCVFDLRLASFSYNEIASLLNVNKKKIDNSLCKIRTKLKKYLFEK